MAFEDLGKQIDAYDRARIEDAIEGYRRLREATGTMGIITLPDGPPKWKLVLVRAWIWFRFAPTRWKIRRLKKDRGGGLPAMRRFIPLPIETAFWWLLHSVRSCHRSMVACYDHTYHCHGCKREWPVS